MEGSIGPRPYSSPRRARQAAQTRSDVVAAATKLFLERGWAGTTVAAVAAEAQVAVDTVYSNFSSKAGLLAAAKDVAKVGDTDPIPLMERPGFEALAQGNREQRIRTAATLIAEFNDRTRPMDTVWRQAAASESELAAALQERELQRRRDLSQGLTRLLGSPVSDSVLDMVWAVSSPEIYGKLHEERAWTCEQYRDWLLMFLNQTLPPSSIS